jgi:putative transposase
MPRYRRHYIKGGTYFFTLVTYKRRRVLDATAVDILRQGFRKCIAERPFAIEGIVILPDHIHCIWKLPPDDCDYSSRWKEIKCHFSKEYLRNMSNSASRDCEECEIMGELPDSMQNKGEKGIWQRRFWEHAIRDEEDYRLHMDYIHYNPVKHGLVSAVIEWPYSSFHRFVSMGIYRGSWAGRADGFPDDIGGE